MQVQIFVCVCLCARARVCARASICIHVSMCARAACVNMFLVIHVLQPSARLRHAQYRPDMRSVGETRGEKHKRWKARDERETGNVSAVFKNVIIHIRFMDNIIFNVNIEQFLCPSLHPLALINVGIVPLGILVECPAQNSDSHRRHVYWYNWGTLLRITQWKAAETPVLMSRIGGNMRLDFNAILYTVCILDVLG